MKNEFRHMMYWDDHVEARALATSSSGARTATRARTVRVSNTNCQCASVDFAVVPPDAYREYLVVRLWLADRSKWSGSVMAHLKLDSKLAWLPLFHGDPVTIRWTGQIKCPAASSVTGPQFALVRLNWKGKGEGTRSRFAGYCQSGRVASRPHASGSQYRRCHHSM